MRLLIARLAAELHCHVPEELDEVRSDLRGLGRRRERLVRAATASVLRIRSFLPAAVTAGAGPFHSVTWLVALQVVTQRREAGAPGARTGGSPASCWRGR